MSGGETEEMLGDAPKQGGSTGSRPPRPGLTFGPLDAGVLVVAEEEALPAAALVAAHHVDAALLAAPVALSALVHICAGRRSVSGGCGHGWCAQSSETSTHTCPPPRPTPGLGPGRSHAQPCSTPEEPTYEGRAGASTWGGDL